jgi:hypothetical protein
MRILVRILDDLLKYEQNNAQLRKDINSACHNKNARHNAQN